MPAGAYSPCPGGTGNNIKFCCTDLLGELQKIERMLDGEQYLACLQHIDHLLKANPDKACLLATKTLLLRILQRAEEARDTVAVFLEKHPDNPIALVESAMLSASQRENRRAMDLLVRAVAASGSEMHSRVYQGIGLISRLLAAQGELLASRALAILQLDIQEDDRQAMQLLVELNSSPRVPLLVKDERILRNCPDDVSWKAPFDEASSMALQARWTEAAQRLAELAEQVDGAPAVWHNLATVRGWLADTPGCIEALQKLATLDVPLEDAVEAEALALFLSRDPLGDMVDVVTLRYTVDGMDELEAALTASPRAGVTNVDLASLATEESPPPKSVFVLFDRALPEPDAEITPETTPKVLCQTLLYGKQTDRDALLEVSEIVAQDLDSTKTLLAEIAGDALKGEPEQTVAHQASATQELLNCNWRLPPNCSQEDFQRMTAQYVEDAILQAWPQAPLGLLDGNCPQEAANQEATRVKVLAAIMVLEFWLEQTGSRFDFNRLRSRLELPVLEPIDPQETPVDDLPLVRWSRLLVDKLSDDALLDGYRRAMSCGVRAAMPDFARAVVERPSLAGREERLMAFQMMARTADDPNQALQYIADGRKEAGQDAGSCAHWDLAELPIRLARGDGEGASQLLNHVQTQHINEPGVARALTDLLIQLGILRPDGTPAGPPPGAPTADDPSLVTPGESDAEQKKLWTPDSQKPAGDKPGIWTPGMD
jgi:hypothetical protein